MKVLVAHNRYRSDVPSGENVVVDDEIRVLVSSGVDVVTLLRSSDEIASMRLIRKTEVAFGPVWSAQGVHDFRALLDAERPDVVHVHNVFPLLSPGIVRAAKKAGVPVVMTVHNFRLDCVAGTYLRDGKVCTECAGRFIAEPAVRHGCYRGSRVQSVPMTLGRSVHRSTWHRVDRFLALTSFHANFLTSLGIREQQIVLRPTSVADPGEPAPPGRDVLFVGRLGTEKGVDILLGAWQRSTASQQGRRLHLVGDGELRFLAEDASRRDTSIVVHGGLPRDAVMDLMRTSGVVVIPSTWFEGLPRVFAEALSQGRPVMVSSIGGLAAVTDEGLGWLVPPGDVDALSHELGALDDAQIAARGHSARDRFLATFDERVTTPTLLDTYRSLV